jgi:DNA repair protein RecO (recombination protein O)
MTPWQDRAFLLRATPYGEADLVGLFLAERHGRVSLLAQGARASRKRFGGVLDYFHLLEIEARPGRSGMGRLLGAQLDRAYPRIREDMAAYWAGSHMLEVMRLGSREGDPDEGLYRLLEAALAALDAGADPASLVRTFQVRVLGILGYAIPLETCSACSRVLAGEEVAWQGSAVTCVGCAAEAAGRLSVGAVRTLQTAVAFPLDRIGGLRFSTGICAEVRALLQAALVAALGASLRTTGEIP